PRCKHWHIYCSKLVIQPGPRCHPVRQVPMKPPRFNYHDQPQLPEALELLAQLGADSKVLAGGQSLIPLLNMRMAHPEHLIDLNRIDELAYLSERDGGIAIGAMTRHRTVERSTLIRKRLPLLAH